jgi:hypothetical protein
MYRVLVSFLIAGREAPQKAQVIADAILTKCERVLEHVFYSYFNYHFTTI